MTTATTRIRRRYRLEREIAVGGMARVWRAVDERLRRPVAVKLLHPHLVRDGLARRRMATEARATAALHHPGIAAVHDVSESRDAPAIVMELVDGASLADHLRDNGPMAPSDAARVVAEVADALHHAHSRGLVHCDVKPGNVLLERRTGRARLIDFGIAHSLAGDAPLPPAGITFGTPRYMAPEQLTGEEVGPRTDVWALGCLLHELLAGRPAFEGESTADVAHALSSGPRPLPSGTPPELASVVRACLATDISQRPSARQVAHDVRAWLGAGAATVPLPAARDRGVDARARAATRGGWRPAAPAWPLPLRPGVVAAVLALMIAAGALAGTSRHGAAEAAGAPDGGQQLIGWMTEGPIDLAAMTTSTANEGADEGRPTGGNAKGRGKSKGQGQRRGAD